MSHFGLITFFYYHKQCYSTCISTQDDRPQFFFPPLCYEGTFETARSRLLDYVKQSIPNGEIVSGGDTSGRYIRVVITKDQFVDDFEIYFTPNDNTIQFRILRRNGKFDITGENKKRIEDIVSVLGFDYVPVLRNRRHALIFF